MASYDIEITEGEDWALSLTLQQDDQAIPLTGYQFEAEIRSGFDDAAVVLAPFVVSVINEAGGELGLSLTAATTQGLWASDNESRPRGRVGFYDVFYTNPTGSRRYLMGGRVTFIQTITRRFGP